MELSDLGWLGGKAKGRLRMGGIKSHAQLDGAETLDTSDKCLLAEGYVELKTLLPGFSIIGDCCGTDHSHLEESVQASFYRTKE